MKMRENDWQDKPGELAQGIYHIEVPTPFSVGPVNIYILEGDGLKCDPISSLSLQKDQLP